VSNRFFQQASTFLQKLPKKGILESQALVKLGDDLMQYQWVFWSWRITRGEHLVQEAGKKISIYT